MTESRSRLRARREGWATTEKLTPTERDGRILYTIGICGVLRTRDIARVFFGTRGTANDRLRKLYCAGFLECFVPSLNADNYYALTPRGHDQVVETYDVEPDTIRVVKKLPAKLDHGLALSEVRLTVSIACERSPAYELVSFQTDADLARARHAELLELVPDGKVVIRAKATGVLHPFFVEVDLGTEAVTWLVRHKLAVYARHAQVGMALYGLHDPLIVLVVGSLRRARNIARTMMTMRVTTRVVFALRSLLTEGTVLGAAYALPGV